VALGAAGARASGRVGLLVLGVLAASRPLLASTPRLLRARGRPGGAVERASSASLEPGALGVLSPMLDDELMRRPARPRVLARISARRLLDAALQRARGAQVVSGRGRAQLEVQVLEDAADVDVEGDPSDLAEALCAVLDNALRLRGEHPEVHLRVHVRGSAGHVTYEVSDDLRSVDAGAGSPRLDEPFRSAVDEGVRPGFGVGLARARLLAERHGGVLLTRKTQEGSCVQLTLQRRRSRSPTGVA
jgi:signal transduction histidine kinase